MSTENVIFMVEGGEALRLVRQHIADRQRVAAEVRVLCQELGVERASTDRLDGRLLGVVFNGKPHADFKAPNKRGVSFPKQGSAWAKRLANQQGHPNAETVISKALGVPLLIGYSSADGRVTGGRCIGNMLTACGWLYLSADGPYAMWVPDVAAEVAADEARGFTVGEPAKSFRLEFDGCRRIEPEEWEILVAQHTLAEKKAKAAKKPAEADAGVQG